VHGGKCSCSTGTRQSYVGILSGSVVPLWQQLLEALADPQLRLPKTEVALRIVRAQLDDGERIIGIRWPAEAFEVLRMRLKALNGEAGYQAALLMPGLRFKLWPLFKVERYPWVQVPPDHIGLVIAQVGSAVATGAKSPSPAWLPEKRPKTSDSHQRRGRAHRLKRSARPRCHPKSPTFSPR
jgi:hypothetical protein